MEFGHVQWSDNITFDTMTVVTSGARADGIRLNNWNPQLTARVVNVTTRGFSADGVNLGRERTDGAFTVTEMATILVEQGMGLRSVTSNISDGIGRIVFSGSSSITTLGAGSNQGGYAVYAGADPLACGPFGLPLYDCRSSGQAEVILGGSANASHVIRTSGDQAYGLYALGRGYIAANNVSITTTGSEAHGINAVRRMARFYHSSAEFGDQDYSGRIGLKGNVTISVGNDAQAIRADSFDNITGPRAGLYLNGNKASILSLTPGRYNINGNILSQNFGLIDLTMGNGSIFTGATRAVNGGDIHLRFNGHQSI